MKHIVTVLLSLLCHFIIMLFYGAGCRSGRSPHEESTDVPENINMVTEQPEKDCFRIRKNNMHTKHRMAKKLFIILVFVMLMISSVGCVKKESALKKDWTAMEFALPENWDDGPVRRYEYGQLTVLGSHPSDGKVCLFTLTEDGGILERRNLPAADRLNFIGRRKVSTGSGGRTAHMCLSGMMTTGSLSNPSCSTV